MAFFTNADPGWQRAKDWQSRKSKLYFCKVRIPLSFLLRHDVAWSATS
jgi:hypothetical protein